MRRGTVPPEFLECVRRAGFRNLGIVVPQRTGDWPSAVDVDQMGRELSRLGLQVKSLHTNLFPVDGAVKDDPVERANHMGRLGRGVDLLHALGGRVYVIDVGARARGTAEQWGMLGAMRTAQGLARLSERCRRKGLAMAIETSPEAIGGEASEGQDVLGWMLRRFPSAHAGVCLDLANRSAFVGILDPLKGVAERILQIHVGLSWLVEKSRAAVETQWGCFLDFLGMIQYRGAIMLEAPATGDALPNADLAAASAMRLFPGWRTERSA
jgi:sugar phosphate isomerase/epimerase